MNKYVKVHLVFHVPTFKATSPTADIGRNSISVGEKESLNECFNIIEHYYLKEELKDFKLTLDLRKEALFQETHLLDF